MKRHGCRTALLGAALLLGACGGSSEVGGGDTPQDPDPTPAPLTRYDMANGCYALQAVDSGEYALRDDEGGYIAAAGDVAAATPLFMKPTALGKYFLYSDNETMLAVSGAAALGETRTLVGSVADPCAEADWTVLERGDAQFTLYSELADRYLAVNEESGLFELATEPFDFAFAAARGCVPFPEIALDVQGQTFKGRGVDQPVLGFAEVHAHASATTFLGGGHYGQPFHKYGVTEALGDCSVQHGPNGILDLVGNLMGGESVNPLAAHDTQGWPTFVDWPNRNSLMHEGMYYRWIERAYMAGMRIMVNDLVENQVLCTLQSVVDVANALDIDVSGIVDNLTELVVPPRCNEMESSIEQIQYMHDLEDYIDAQSGGPGKGWFRIVESPQEARSIINEGKLAVVLGIEISHIFNCQVIKVGGLTPDINGCDKTEIDTQLDRLYNLGVRQMFPLHEFDNSLGGNGIFDGLILNVGNFVDTLGFWETYTCPDQPYFFDAGADMTTSLPVDSLNPLVDLLTNLTQGLVPLYPTGKQCNSRWFTDLGRYAMERLMDKKIIIEVDHMDLKMKTQLLDMAEERSPAYPLVSTHGGHGGISMEQARRLLADGGLLYPAKGNGIKYNEQRELLRTVKSPDYLFAMGYGADMNGLAHQSPPRGSDAEPVQYPFTLFSGPGWGPQFDGLQPLVFEQSAVPEGGRYFDINSEGLAQYGMIADWVEAVRIEGGEQAITDLYNSAELYLQMWERTINR